VRFRSLIRTSTNHLGAKVFPFFGKKRARAAGFFVVKDEVHIEVVVSANPK